MADLKENIVPEQYRDILFIHIPKTAGTSMSASIFGEEYGTNHLDISYYKKELPPDIFQKIFKFSFVRNPFDRLVSAFFDVPQFVYPKRNKILFNNFIQEYLDTNEVFLGQSIKYLSQNKFIYEDGNLGVDFVGKFENIEEDWNIVCNIINVKNNLSKLNKGSHENYKKYYDEKSKKIVENIYKEDLELFNYSFN